MVRQFDFDIHFQRNLLTFMVQKPGFIETYSEVLKPDFFEKIIHSDLCSLILKLKKDFGSLPTYPVLLQACRKFLEIQVQGKPDVAKYEAEIEKVYSTDLRSEEDYTGSLILAFARQRAMEKAIFQSAELCKRGKFSEVEILVKQALQTGQNLQDLGLDFFGKLDGSMESVFEEEMKVPTLFRELDRAIGGLGEGELGVVLGPPGRGKSMFLLALAVAGMILGLPVVYYSLEMSERLVQRRLIARLSGEPEKGWLKSLLHKDTERLMKKLKMFQYVFGGRIFIKRYPAGRCSVRTLEGHLEQLKGIGFVPGLVLVDYADLMQAERHYKDAYSELAVIYRDLRDLSIVGEVPIWTGCKATRKSLSKEIIGMDDVADSFQKCFIADLILALCQTKKEEAEDKMRVYVAKNREGSKGMVIPFEVDWDRALIDEEVQRKERRKND